MVGAPVGAVDYGIGRALQLVIEAAVDQPADDRIVDALAGEHIARGAAFDAAFSQAAVDALDDVAALAERAQRLLGILRYDPLAGTDLIGEAECLQLAQPTDLQRVEFVWLPIGMWGEVGDAGAIAIAGNLAIEIGPAFRLDLTPQVAADLVIGARSQLLGDEVLRAGAHAFLDVVAGDDEVLAVVSPSPQDDMDMRVVGVPVIDADPVELRAQVLLHLPHQFAGIGLEVAHLGRVLW